MTVHEAERRVNPWMCYFFPYTALPEQLLTSSVYWMNRTWLQLSVPAVTDISNGNRHDEGTIGLNSAFLIKLHIAAEACKNLKSVASQVMKLSMIPNQDFL